MVRKQVRDDSSLLLWVVYSRTHCDRRGISEDKRSVRTQLDTAQGAGKELVVFT